ncbi:hypothetical protein AB205_0129330 [Aquarana catesbeiana]|uniref:GCF C-terminal domain-containing protein n=1 Tax=Aquarana catesbeiana TaxID=8400 RepID=A0A2G9REG9_AQUCT|nr:hypothetical protein AB205_0129330 [Aquarana catesbeiana]
MDFNGKVHTIAVRSSTVNKSITCGEPDAWIPMGPIRKQLLRPDWPGSLKTPNCVSGHCSPEENGEENGPALQVENWNPLTDTVPIHSWIHPWLPLMQSRLEPLFSPIRNKLASALQKWHPSDSSAKLILQPWKDVFTPGSWDAFMVKNIVPKLVSSPADSSII